MFPDWQPHAHLHLYRLSDGAERHTREIGKFELRYTGKSETFNSLLSAFKAYIAIPYSAAIFDITEQDVLIERKLVIKLN